MLFFCKFRPEKQNARDKQRQSDRLIPAERLFFRSEQTEKINQCGSGELGHQNDGNRNLHKSAAGKFAFDNYSA